ncbi:MAG: ABC transporter substrate-binding protein, partial [Bauldia litoralis]
RSITTDKMLTEKPDLVKRFLTASQNAFKWAQQNPEEACKLHVERVPEVALDDCLGSVKATLAFVFNEHSAKTGLGLYDPERLGFTWNVVAEAQQLDKSWDPKLAIDVSDVPTN